MNVLVSSLIQNVAQKIRPCPGKSIRAAYVRGVRSWCGETRWYRVTLDAQVVANVFLYSTGADPLLEVIDIPYASVVTNPNVSQQNVVPLIPQATNAWNPNILPSTPIYYAYVAE